MIKNEKQFKISKAWLRKFEQGLVKLENLPTNKRQPWLRRAQSGSLKAQIQQIRNEVREYEDLKSGKTKVSSLEILTTLPVLLIKKRIANGWTQQEFASRLGLHYQQIQRYENTDYATATLETMQKAATILSSVHIQ